MELRGWVIFGNIWHGKGWMWPNDAVAVVGFQKPWKGLLQVAAQSLPLCAGVHQSLLLCSSHLIYEVGLGWSPPVSPVHTDVLCANLLGWTGLVGVMFPSNAETSLHY